MKHTDGDTFKLDCFEGPLAFLLHLIQKKEIKIYDIPIQEITNQYLSRIKDLLSLSVDAGSEVVGTTAFLMWLKSKSLLPKHEQIIDEDEELDPHFEIIHKLIEYCRIKEAAQHLSEQEQKQGALYYRAVHSLPEAKKTLGIEHLSLDDFATLFQQILHKAHTSKGKIHEEPWRVSDKIKIIRVMIKSDGKIRFSQLFSRGMVRGELIVNFLAILELMKNNELFIALENETNEVMIFPGEQSNE